MQGSRALIHASCRRIVGIACLLGQFPVELAGVMQVIGVGFGRTGTVSMNSALERLGARPLCLTLGTQSWEPLCDFLGVLVPEEPFPQASDADMFARAVGPLLFRRSREV
ncbi:sulfotransferase [Nonomuraea guangzhouensis]|uniref:Sulfotransferase n=1 Tax=Nonomuraea guangzhouensis TaxID=1291555 RepID=A0ABW4GQX5_9ACTN|nr:sulfotransferase [Nonomuraea guangzhouensis]